VATAATITMWARKAPSPGQFWICWAPLSREAALRTLCGGSKMTRPYLASSSEGRGLAWRQAFNSPTRSNENTAWPRCTSTFSIASSWSAGR
jgi:hypothetical protein